MSADSHDFSQKWNCLLSPQICPTVNLAQVLAVSDVVIYRSRAERLHNDLFYFLGDAAKSYNHHFQVNLSLRN